MVKFFLMLWMLLLAIEPALQATSLETRLQKAGLAYRAAETTMSQVEADIKISENSLLQKTEAFKGTTKKMGQLLMALRTLKTTLPSHILTATHSAQDVLHKTTMMHAYVNGLHTQIDRLKKDISDLEQLKKDLNQKKEALHKSVGHHKTAYEKLETLVAVQAQALKQQKDAEEKQKRYLAKASNLKDLLRNLEKITSIPDSTVNATGLLLPIQGPLVVPYGTKNAKSPDGKGIVLRARPKAFVLAPTTGKVLFAGPFRTYNHIVILGFNKHYTVLLTGLAQLSVKTGQSVKVGDPIGQMNPKNKAYLYLEMRKKGTPIKPKVVGIT